MTKALTILAVSVLILISAASAEAELTQRGNLFVRFDGGISPAALPRDSLAPISVRIEGTIRSGSADQSPPALRSIRIALNRGGILNSRGLPVCRQAQIDLSTSTEALAVCGPALVGAGGMVARTDLPDQSTAVVRGEIILFNSVVNGRPAILGHIYQTEPTAQTRIVVFHIRRTGGTFGTVITGHLPRSLNRHGYLKTLFLQLQRSYVFRGHSQSYLSASCPAPAGFPGAVFPFARASMTFDGGRTLTSVLTRSCKVRS